LGTYKAKHENVAWIRKETDGEMGDTYIMIEKRINPKKNSRDFVTGV